MENSFKCYFGLIVSHLLSHYTIAMLNLQVAALNKELSSVCSPRQSAVSRRRWSVRNWGHNYANKGRR